MVNKDIFKTKSLNYAQVCDRFQIDPDSTWGFFLGLDDNNEYHLYHVVDPDPLTAEDGFPIDLECGFFAEIEDAPNGFLPEISGTFILRDKILMKEINPFYFESIDDLPEEDKMIDVSNPFDILKQLDQMSLAKSFTLGQLEEIIGDNEDEDDHFEDFRDLLDDFYYEYLVRFITNTRTLIMIKQYQLMERQLDRHNEKPDKVIKQWVA